MIDVMVWVLNESEAKHGDRLVLLALAEYAHKDGTKAFPRIEELRHRARLSERQTQESLRNLEAKGAISQTDTTRGGVKVYRVHMDEHAAKLKGVRNPRGAKSAGADSRTKGVQNDVGRGAESRGALIKEPSEPSKEPSPGAAKPSRTDAPLSHLLADLIARNDPDGSRPTPGKGWADAERLLQSKDGRSPEQIEMVIRWCMDDHFEQSNILSMPKLRKRYRELLSKATKGQPNRKPGSAASKADDDIRRLAELSKRLKEEGR